MGLTPRVISQICRFLRIKERGGESSGKGGDYYIRTGRSTAVP